MGESSLHCLGLSKRTVVEHNKNIQACSRLKTRETKSSTLRAFQGVMEVNNNREVTIMKRKVMLMKKMSR
jgi:hypothetical protein